MAVHVLILHIWWKRKKATINPKHNDDKCFQYAAIIALNFNGIKKDPWRVSNIKPFINNYNWERINCPSKIEDWKRFEKKNPTVALNFLYIKEQEIWPVYISKINSSC